MLRPILNPNNMPEGDMFLALNWLETLCRLSGKTEISEGDVVQHLLKEEGRLDLAKAFVKEYLLPLPDAVEVSEVPCP